MAFQLREQDVSVLRELATSAGLGPEYVTALRRRAELRPEAREGAPYVLLLGDSHAMHELLATIADATAAQEVRNSTAAAIVVGRRPHLARPMVSAWHTVTARQLALDSLIIVKAVDRIPDGTLHSLASLGTIELGILVSRLAQPLNQGERNLATSVAEVVESMRVVFIGYPSDRLTAGEAGQLADFARVQMRHAGFGPMRFEGSLLWLGGNAAKGLPGQADSPGELVAVNAATAGRNRDAALATSLGRLLDRIEQQLAANPRPVGLPATETDIEKLARQFEGHVDGLGLTLRRLLTDGQIRTSEQARKFLIDTVTGWTGGQGLQGATLTLAEKFRPSIKTALDAEVRAIAPEVSVDPVQNKMPGKRRSDEAHALFAFLRKHHWARAVAAAAVGALAVLIGMFVLPMLGVEIWATRLGALGVAAILALVTYFVLGEPWIIRQGPHRRAEATREGAEPVSGWPVVQARLTAAFISHLREDSTVTALRSIHEIRERLVNGRCGE